MEPLLGILLVIALVGVVVWLLWQLPMPPLFRNVILAVAAIVVILWLLGRVGGSPLPF